MDKPYDDLNCVVKNGLPICLNVSYSCGGFNDDQGYCRNRRDGALCDEAVRRDRKRVELLDAEGKDGGVQFSEWHPVGDTAHWREPEYFRCETRGGAVDLSRIGSIHLEVYRSDFDGKAYQWRSVLYTVNCITCVLKESLYYRDKEQAMAKAKGWLLGKRRLPGAKEAK